MTVITVRLAANPDQEPLEPEPIRIGEGEANRLPPPRRYTIQTDDGRTVTICTDELPDSGAYQHWNSMSPGQRKKLAIRRNMRRRKGKPPN